MPEFILAKDGRVPIAGAAHIQGASLAFHNLDPFTQGYIEALFFTSTGPGVSTAEFKTRAYQRRLREGTADGSLPGDVGFADLAPEALAEIITDCKEFQLQAADFLAQAYSRNYTAEQAGRDFWFTRNGHGVGFWDRPELTSDDDLGDALSTIAREFGETDASFGRDNRVHLL